MAALVAVVGMVLAWLVSTGIGATLVLVGSVLFALSVVSIVYLWLSERWLPKARREETASVQVKMLTTLL